MTQQSHYAQAGVDIDAGQKAVDLMKSAVQATYTRHVLSDTKSFGGLFALSDVQSMNAPVLVASTDGVGTKTKVASRLQRWDTIGQDLVNHCINDILVQGARPLFFLDYVASSKLVPEQIAAIVTGMAQACKEAGCALIGGETAEMPGVYEAGEVDVAGTIVGVVERAKLLNGSAIQAGDVILGIPSAGLHTNGFSLARHVLADLDWTTPHPELGQSIGDALLAVHRSYLPHVEKLWSAGVTVRGLAHLTGGGILDNLPRIFPEGLGAKIQVGTWDVLPIFRLIQTLGGIDPLEMHRVFNMGLGMLVVVPPADAEKALATLAGDISRVGEMVSGAGEVQLEGLS